MKKLRDSIFASMMLLLMGCDASSSSEQAAVPLPFFNEPTFTPEWIESSSPKYDSIHTIGAFAFTNQHNKLITQKTIEGKIVVVNFFFTSCPGICPRMMSNLLAVQEAFGDDDDFAMLSHSVTPWIDTVLQLRQYAEHKGITADNWHLLTGDKLAIYTAARESYFADEGFGKSVTIEDDFLHTENLVLVDTKGRIRGVYNATLPVEINRLIEDIHLLRAEQS